MIINCTKPHHFMQSVELTVAFLYSVLPAIHQHVNFKDLIEKNKKTKG